MTINYFFVCLLLLKVEGVVNARALNYQEVNDRLHFMISGQYID